MTKTEHKQKIQKFWQEDFPDCIAGKKSLTYEQLFKEYSFFSEEAAKKPRKGPAEIREYWQLQASKKPRFRVPLTNIYIFENYKFLIKESDSCYAPYDKIAIVFVTMNPDPKETPFRALMGHIEDCIWVPIEFGL